MGVGGKHGHEIDLNMLWLEIRRFLIFNTNSLWNSFLMTEAKERKPKLMLSLFMKTLREAVAAAAGSRAR